LGLKELASATGLSISTVSRALSGSQLVNDRTRQRVLAVANVSQMNGQGLRARLGDKAAHALALVQPSLDQTDGHTEVSVQILETMQDVAERHQCSIAALRLRADGDGQEPLPMPPSVLGAVGFRLLDAHVPVFLRQVRAANVPFVILNRVEDDPAVPTCTVDHVQCGRLAAGHLADLGHRSIAMLFNSSHIQPNRLRIRGISQIMAERGLDMNPALVRMDLTTPTLLSHALREVIDVHRATAVIAANDRMALAIIRQLREEHRRVPEDVSIVGIDGTHAGMDSSPALTSVHLPWAQMAAGAARLLFWLREDPALAEVHLVWKPTLMERQTTAGPR
jgi:DNA-binding LacI/PurR family transcriptional regulator